MQRKHKLVVAATLIMLVGAAYAYRVGDAYTAPRSASDQSAAPTAHAPQKTPEPTQRPDLPTCKDDAKTKATTTTKRGNPEARVAAQKGLDFLAEQSAKWQKKHQCYGCHVQAVTMEAFAVGRKHDYQVSDDAYATVIKGLTNIQGGSRDPGGVPFAKGNSLKVPGRTFGGAALARHDALTDDKLSDDLLETADKLRQYVQQDGSLSSAPYKNPPVGMGKVQSAYQAIATWKQAYTRSADERWLTYVQKAEGFLQDRVDAWHGDPPAKVQHVNYAILGLLEAGTGTEEDSLIRLRKMLVDLQNGDGGWGFKIEQSGGILSGTTGSRKGSTSSSNAFVTGQTLYVLRRLGLSDEHAAIARGTAWLMEHQADTGGWSMGGFGKAEAMWGVLGLVSLDVLSITVDGIERGQHVDGTTTIGAEAWDNSGAEVERIEIAVDDITVHRTCADEASFAWDASTLEAGKHLVDVRAYNSRGEVSTRRISVYAGDHYLTQIGTEYSDGGTLITMRNIAPEEMVNEVAVDIFSTTEKDGTHEADQKLRSLEVDGQQGPMAVHWDGRDTDGERQEPGQRYQARLTFVDAKGKARQSETVTFVYDTPASQRRSFGQISGKLRLKRQKRGAANTVVELVDENGQVVKRTRSTANGQYRFKNLDDQKKYKIRVNKKGFGQREAEAPEETEAGKEQVMDLDL